ncbi:MAG: pectinesterase family protein [Litorilinea sp.]
MNRRVLLVLAAVLGATLAFGALTNIGRSLASTLQFTSVPSTISYQGFLNDSGGNPISATVTLDFSIWDASSGGSQVWSETHNNVMVSEGFFSVQLGSQSDPLAASDFSGTPRYLEVTYDGVTFPRQVFSTVPFAFVAAQASQAISATHAMSATYAMNASSAMNATNAMSATNAMTATYALSSGSGSSGGVDWGQVVVVAKSGGDYTSISDAMSAISPTSESRYLVLVMPGVYSGQVTVKEYVHVKGMGVETTYITSDANTGNIHDEEAATLILPANSQVSDLTVRNTAAVQHASALHVDSGNSSTRLNNVRAETTGAGGIRHAGVYLSGSGMMLEHVYGRVAGTAATSGWALYGNGAAFMVRDSAFYAPGTAGWGMGLNGGTRVDIIDTIVDATSGSIGINANGADFVYIDHSIVRGGDATAISAANNSEVFVGASLVDGTVVAATGGAPQTEVTCAQSYKGDYTELNNTATSCN